MQSAESQPSRRLSVRASRLKVLTWQFHRYSRMLAIDKHTALSLAAAFTAGWIVHSLLVSYADEEEDEIELPPKRANHVWL